MTQYIASILKGLLVTLLALNIFNCASTPPVTPEVVVDPLRFSQVVAEFKSADSLQMPRRNSTLFVGSSTIQRWETLAADFPELNVINRGIGGSHMSDLIYYMDDIVFPYRPSAIVVYEGDNDIAAGKTPERVLADFDLFVAQASEKLPGKSIFFVAIKPSVSRVDHLERMASANALIEARTKENENLYFIDVFTPMLDDAGQPRADVFVEDNLHLNEAGYALWAKHVRMGLGLD